MSDCDYTSAEEASHPILSCKDASDWEKRALETDRSEWAAMQAVGRQLGAGILADYRMTRYAEDCLKTFALIGTGHNGGDALLAIGEMHRRGVIGKVALAIVGSLADLKPRSRQAFDLLERAVPQEDLATIELIESGEPCWLARLSAMLGESRFDIGIDGLLGMSFRPPLREIAKEALARFNGAAVRLKVAVDLPSGLGDTSDESRFKADATYATGILKKPLLCRANANSVGCIRYLDIGFFRNNFESTERVLTDSILDPIRERRASHSDKRSHGRLLILAGSAKMPGALLMCVRSALQSGVGLLTVCAPESLVPQFAAAVPEAMWVPWPETPGGGLALEGISLLKRLGFEPDAVVMGPGIGSEAESVALLAESASVLGGPVVVDADALRPEVIESWKGRFVATPHEGEFQRLLREPSTLDKGLMDYARSNSGVIALKGPNTRISDGTRLYLNPTGNAVLARGGSGDLLAGMTGALLAASPERPLDVVCRAVYWHGKVADAIAARKGQVAVRTTDLLDMYGPALML